MTNLECGVAAEINPAEARLKHGVFKPGLG
jgi:hypothetical protein